MILQMSILLYSLCMGVLLPNLQKNKKYYLIMMFVILTFFSGLRGIDVGIDTKSYVAIFNQVNMQPLMDSFNNSRIENGYILLNYVVGRFTDNPQAILLITSIIINYSFARAIYKYSDNVAISTFIHVMFFYNSTMNLIRQYIALSIFLFGLDYLLRKDRLKFILVVLVASLFHSSSLILIIFVIATSDYLKEKKWLMGSVIVLASFGVYNFEYLVNVFVNFFPVYARFLESSISTASSDISIINLILYIILLVLNMRQLYTLNTNEINREEFSNVLRYKTILSIWQILLIMFFIFSGRLWIASRFLTYFRPALIFIIPSVLKYLKVKKDLIYIYLQMTVIVLAILWSYSMFATDPSGLLPYYMFFNN